MVGAVVEADGERFTIATKSVVNAGGVWADDVRALDEGLHPDSIRPAKGVHITLPWSLVRNDIAVIIPVRRDKRSLFLVPWGALDNGEFQHVYIGTTDTDYDGSMSEPLPDGDDIDYILEALNQSLDTSRGTGHHPRRHHRRVGRPPTPRETADRRPEHGRVGTAETDGPKATKDLSRRHHVGRSDVGRRDRHGRQADHLPRDGRRHRRRHRRRTPERHRRSGAPRSV